MPLTTAHTIAIAVPVTLAAIAAAAWGLSPWSSSWTPAWWETTKHRLGGQPDLVSSLGMGVVAHALSAALRALGHLLAVVLRAIGLDGVDYSRARMAGWVMAVREGWPYNAKLVTYVRGADYSRYAQYVGDTLAPVQTQVAHLVGSLYAQGQVYSRTVATHAGPVVMPVLVRGHVLATTLDEHVRTHAAAVGAYAQAKGITRTHLQWAAVAFLLFQGSMAAVIAVLVAITVETESSPTVFVALSLAALLNRPKRSRSHRAVAQQDTYADHREHVALDERVRAFEAMLEQRAPLRGNGRDTPRPRADPGTSFVNFPVPLPTGPLPTLADGTPRNATPALHPDAATPTSPPPATPTGTSVIAPTLAHTRALASYRRSPSPRRTPSPRRSPSPAHTPPSRRRSPSPRHPYDPPAAPDTGTALASMGKMAVMPIVAAVRGTSSFIARATGKTSGAGITRTTDTATLVTDSATGAADTTTPATAMPTMSSTRTPADPRSMPEPTHAAVGETGVASTSHTSTMYSETVSEIAASGTLPQTGSSNAPLSDNRAPAVTSEGGAPTTASGMAPHEHQTGHSRFSAVSHSTQSAASRATAALSSASTTVAALAASVAPGQGEEKDVDQHTPSLATSQSAAKSAASRATTALSSASTTAAALAASVTAPEQDAQSTPSLAASQAAAKSAASRASAALSSAVAAASTLAASSATTERQAEQQAEQKDQDQQVKQPEEQYAEAEKETEHHDSHHTDHHTFSTFSPLTSSREAAKTAASRTSAALSAAKAAGASTLATSNAAQAAELQADQRSMSVAEKAKSAASRTSGAMTAAVTAAASSLATSTREQEGEEGDMPMSRSAVDTAKSTAKSAAQSAAARTTAALSAAKAAGASTLATSNAEQAAELQADPRSMSVGEKAKSAASRTSAAMSSAVTAASSSLTASREEGDLSTSHSPVGTAKDATQSAAARTSAAVSAAKPAGASTLAESNAAQAAELQADQRSMSVAEKAKSAAARTSAALSSATSAASASLASKPTVEQAPSSRTVLDTAKSGVSRASAAISSATSVIASTGTSPLSPVAPEQQLNPASPATKRASRALSSTSSASVTPTLTPSTASAEQQRSPSQSTHKSAASRASAALHSAASAASHTLAASAASAASAVLTLGAPGHAGQPPMYDAMPVVSLPRERDVTHAETFEETTETLLEVTDEPTHAASPSTASPTQDTASPSPTQHTASPSPAPTGASLVRAGAVRVVRVSDVRPAPAEVGTVGTVGSPVSSGVVGPVGAGVVGSAGAEGSENSLGDSTVGPVGRVDVPTEQQRGAAVATGSQDVKMVGSDMAVMGSERMSTTVVRTEGESTMAKVRDVGPMPTSPSSPTSYGTAKSAATRASAALSSAAWAASSTLAATAASAVRSLSPGVKDTNAREPTGGQNVGLVGSDGVGGVQSLDSTRNTTDATTTTTTTQTTVTQTSALGDLGTLNASARASADSLRPSLASLTMHTRDALNSLDRRSSTGTVATINLPGTLVDRRRSSAATYEGVTSTPAVPGTLASVDASVVSLPLDETLTTLEALKMETRAGDVGTRDVAEAGGERGGVDAASVSVVAVSQVVPRGGPTPAPASQDPASQAPVSQTPRGPASQAPATQTTPTQAAARQAPSQAQTPPSAVSSAPLAREPVLPAFPTLEDLHAESLGTSKSAGPDTPSGASDIISSNATRSDVMRSNATSTAGAIVLAPPITEHGHGDGEDTEYAPGRELESPVSAAWSTTSTRATTYEHIAPPTTIPTPADMSTGTSSSTRVQYPFPRPAPPPIQTGQEGTHRPPVSRTASGRPILFTHVATPTSPGPGPTPPPSLFPAHARGPSTTFPRMPSDLELSLKPLPRAPSPALEARGGSAFIETGRAPVYHDPAPACEGSAGEYHDREDSWQSTTTYTTTSTSRTPPQRDLAAPITTQSVFATHTRRFGPDSPDSSASGSSASTLPGPTAALLQALDTPAAHHAARLNSLEAAVHALAEGQDERARALDASLAARFDAHEAICRAAMEALVAQSGALARDRDSLASAPGPAASTSRFSTSMAAESIMSEPAAASASAPPVSSRVSTGGSSVMSVISREVKEVKEGKGIGAWSRSKLPRKRTETKPKLV